MSYVSYGSESVEAVPSGHHHHHHERREHRDRYPAEYVDESSYAVVPRARGGDEYLRETIAADEYRPARSRQVESIDVRYDREGNRVASRRAVSLERHRARGSGDYYAAGAVARYGDDPRRSMTIVEQNRSRRGPDPYEEEKHPRRQSASRGEQLVGAATGAGLAVAGKELWDRREGHRRSDPRGALTTAAVGVAGAVAGVQAAKYYEKSREPSYSPPRRATTTAEYDRRRHGSRSPSPEHHGRRKSLAETALAALGIKEVLGRTRSKSRGHGHSNSGSHSRHRRGSSSSRSPERGDKIKKAAQAALTAAAVEAFRSRKEPGGLMGERGRRIAEAAIAAGGINAAVDTDPEHHSKRHLAEAVLGGLASQRILNGPRSRSGSRSHSRHRRSSSSHGLKDLAAGGLAAAAGKAFLDRKRSKSRDRTRSRSRDRYASSRSPSPRPRRHSLGGYLEKGLGALGLNEAAHHGDGDRRSNRREGRDSRDHRARSDTRRRDSSSDMSPSDEERQRRKLRGKEFLKAGLAAVATIHAAHGMIESMEGAKERRKALREGDISPEEASREKAKALTKDVASLGLVALGTRSAIGGWKKMNAQRHEYHEFEHKRADRRRQRERGRGRSRSMNGS